MEKGFIQTGRSMVWVKRRHKLFLVPDEGEVSLGFDPLFGLLFDAYICRDCKKVVMEYDDAE